MVPLGTNYCFYTNSNKYDNPMNIGNLLIYIQLPTIYKK